MLAETIPFLIVMGSSSVSKALFLSFKFVRTASPALRLSFKLLASRPAKR
jgi:hypothetical protein